MSELLDAVRAGRVEDVPGLLKPLTARERAAGLRELKALRAEVRDRPWTRWQERRRLRDALLVAGAGCQRGAASAVAWLGAADLRGGDGLPDALLAEVLSYQDPAWLAEVAHRLAGRASTAQEDYPLVAALVRLAGCPMPVTDALTRGWVDAIAMSGSTTPLASGLRADPQAREMVFGLFEVAELPFVVGWHPDPGEAGDWPGVLAALAGEGVLERDTLVAACLARLLRGGRTRDLPFFLKLLRRLELTGEEERAHVADWIGMVSDGASTVAALAQEVLARLAQSGALPAAALADMSGSALFRPEKKLVKAQLVLLGKVLRSDPAAAGVLLPVVGEAFGHEDTDVQDRALKLVARHLPAVDGDVRSALAAAAAGLSPVHRARAAGVFGGQAVPVADAGPYEEILPPVPRPVLVAPAAASLAELVEEMAAFARAGAEPGAYDPAGMIAFERLLDGLVRHAHTDRAGLADALRDPLADRWWRKYDGPGDLDFRAGPLPGVDRVAAAVLEQLSVRALWDANARPARSACCAETELDGVVEARLREIAYLVRTRSLPFLLATPTWSTGTVDPDALVERLRTYQRLCAAPAPVDFAQALVRVRREGTDPATIRAAAALGTTEGDRLAAWLAGKTPAPGLKRADEPADGERSEGAYGWSRSVPGRLLVGTRQRLVVRRDFPPAFQWLGRASAPSRTCHHWSTGVTHWPGVLPEDRETLAAWLLPGMAAGVEGDKRAGTWWLPVVAEAGGPAGPAVRLGIAYGLAARHPRDRLSAVDALLVLAARGQLDGPQLGLDMAMLAISGTVKLNRVADSARTAAATGAYRTVWSVLGAALSGLLTDTSRPGLGDLLSVAAECVESGAVIGEDPVTPALAAVAERGGSSRLTAQAARLLTALRQ
ncbi:DUF6493 family protein [Streptomyces liangshanensis]|uniref:DUF7824 domain-containing protein n=1 Tax=Streptomyces liangshanensis TaxID=2717324 RepID=A0A6G9H5Y0_9ACTN|nr:DUF6493 family protein [Streptomyces liangshanensis]QIQ05942.1 hypothetical protein HA039_29800 [Streptomyces liangshanensis]